ncbi:hypothetical protein [Polyangium sp. 15x6]|uniref:hypothetical protein n=1 Tax=Polyangium sp. 15x6 TaxID=3042687 RepID=UPI00249A54CA|nr:hypothetical protein [Polyangium sp. 15x6]MDI3290643.1 hypothetical protein [Polyangium sp. 15x6]
MILALGTPRKVLLPLALCLVACSGEDDSEAAGATQISVFTGRLETADAVVGLAVSDRGDVEAYVCGGAMTFATHSRWFVGSLSSGSASLEAEGLRLDLTLQGEATDITLTAADGAVHSTQAARAGAGSRSALFESPTDASCRWGVVMLDDGGAAPDIFGAWCSRTGSMYGDAPDESTEVFAQVTPVEPVDFGNTLLPVVANTPAGEQFFEVRRISARRADP